MVTEVSAATFEAEVLKSDKPVIVDLWASWCGPCQMMSPIVDELAEEREDVKFCKINVDENMDLARQLRIASIPTFLLFVNGELKDSIVGAVSKSELKAMLG